MKKSKNYIIRLIFVLFLLCFYSINIYGQNDSNNGLQAFMIIEENISEVRLFKDDICLVKPIYFSIGIIDSLTYVPEPKVLKELGYSEKFEPSMYKHYEIHRFKPNSYYHLNYIANDRYGDLIHGEQVDVKEYTPESCNKDSFLNFTNKKLFLIKSVVYNSSRYNILYSPHNTINGNSIIIQKDGSCETYKVIKSNGKIDINNIRLFKNAKNTQFIIQDDNCFFSISFGASYEKTDNPIERPVGTIQNGN